MVDIERLRGALNPNLDKIPLGIKWYEQVEPIDSFDSNLFELGRNMELLSEQYLEYFDEHPIEGWENRLLFYLLRRRSVVEASESIGFRTEPGKGMEWSEFRTEFKGVSFIFNHGSFRLLPTKGQMDLVLGGAAHNPQIKSVLMIEPQENIIEYKGGMVLPRWVRGVFWKMLPGVDVVVNTPRFYMKEDRLAVRRPEEWEEFWIDRYEEISWLRKSGSQIFQSISVGQEWSERKLARSKDFGIIPIEIDQSGVDFISSTLDSEDLLRGYDYFVEAASKLLVDFA